MAGAGGDIEEGFSRIVRDLEPQRVSVHSTEIVGGPILQPQRDLSGHRKGPDAQAEIGTGLVAQQGIVIRLRGCAFPRNPD